MRQRTRVHISLDHTMRSDTTSHIEALLPLREFGLFLQRRNLPGSTRTLYRWLNIQKSQLPREVQNILLNAPSLWFVELQPELRLKGYTHGIPIRYFEESLQPELLAHSINTGDTHLHKTLRAMKCTLIQLKEDVDRLEHYLTATQGKESAHDGDRTHRHSLTA